MKKRINPPEIYQSSNMHNMWPVDEYIIGICSRGRSTEKIVYLRKGICVSIERSPLILILQMCSFYFRSYLGNITGVRIGILIWFKQFPKTTEPTNLNSYDNCVSI